MLVFLKSKWNNVQFASSGQISLSPLNGETVMVVPSKFCGMLSEKPPSTYDWKGNTKLNQICVRK